MGGIPRHILPHESAHLTDDQIRMGWVFLTARSAGTPLFFSRPAGSTRDNYWGNNLVGPRGNDEFFHPEVVAVNAFRHAMAGQKETIETSPDGAVAIVGRGDAGAALVNFSNKPAKVKLPTALPDGTYTDAVGAGEFKVRNGILTGALKPLTSAILYR